MPSLLKDRANGRLGRLISALRPARAGPLPVQTGFPTSLADLFVKNHGRLRKPSSCAPTASSRKKRGAPPLPTPPPSPAPSPPASSPPSPPPPAAVSPPTQAINVLPPSEPVFCHTGGGSAFGLGLGFLALVGVVSLAILVIWSRKVVAAVTVAAFSLFLLESVRSISLRRRPRPPAAKDAVDLGGRGYVSPIREVEAEPEPPRRSFSDSGRGTDIVPILATEDRIEERNEAGDDASNPKAKPKKRSWKKLIPRKLQKGRIRKEAESSPSVSFRSESSEADAMSVGGNATAADLSDSRRGSTRSQADAVARSLDSSGPLPLHGDGTGVDDAEARNDGGRPIGIDASAGLAVVDGVGGGRGGGGWFPLGVPVIVVLVGLFAGRLPAVAFTVLCSAFVSSLQRLSVNFGR